MSRKETKIFRDLKREVIDQDFCLRCGACVASCPVDSLEFEVDTPSLKDRCIACGYCYAQCPELVSDEKLKKKFFGESSSSKIGPYMEAFSGRANSSSVKKSAQDGGVVTALLVSLLKEGWIDGAALMDRDSEWRPQPRVAKTKKSMIECAGTKYTPGPILTALREAVDVHGLEKIALVGTPCQIKGFRNMEFGKKPFKKISEKVVLTIGLFCTKSFTYEGLIEKVVVDQLGIDLRKISKFDIKGKNLTIYLKDGEEEKVPLREIGEFALKPCGTCMDFSGELADISVGSVGSPAGWSTTILRTERGKEAFDLGRKSKAYEIKELDEVKPGMSLVEKLSNIKRKKSEKKIGEYRKREGGSLPSKYE